MCTPPISCSLLDMPSSSSNSAQNLPLDVLSDILSRLPVKFLCRFRCVSKSWSSLISDPHFQQSHDHRAEKNPLIVATFLETKSLIHHLFDRVSRTLRVETLPFGPGLRAGGRFRNNTDSLDVICTHDDYNIFIYNPAGNKWVVLPSPRSQYDSHSHKCRLVVFQYVRSVSEYKVLHILLDSNNTGYDYVWDFEVLTLGSKCWRTVKLPPPITELGGHPVVAGVAVYFLGASRNGSCNVVRFHWEKEDWLLIPFPQEPGRHLEHENYTERLIFYRSYYLTQARGELCLWRNGSKHGWLLKDPENGIWVERVEQDYGLYPSHEVAIKKGGKTMFHLSDKLGYYDPRSRRFEQEQEGWPIDLITSSCVETFRSLSHKCFSIEKIEKSCCVETFKSLSQKCLSIEKIEKRKKGAKKQFLKKQDDSISTKNRFCLLDDESG